MVKKSFVCWKMMLKVWSEPGIKNINENGKIQEIRVYILHLNVCYGTYSNEGPENILLFIKAWGNFLL